MKLLIHLALAASSLGAALALTTLGVWVLRPEWVQASDVEYRERFERAANERVEGLVLLARTEPRAAADGLRALATELATARKGDRRYGARRAALRELSEALAAAGAEEESVAVARELAALDARDIDARSWLTRRLLGSDATRAEGLRELSALFDELPEVGSIARAYHDALVEAGLEEAAGAALARHVRRAPRAETMYEGVADPWRLFWHATTEFTQEQSEEFAPGVWGRFLAVAFEVPAGATFLRIDPPAHSRLTLDQPRIVLSTATGPAPLPIPFERVSASGLSIDAGALVMTGAVDPWFFFEVPENRRAEAFSGRLVFGMQRPPRWIGEAALRPAARGALEAMEDARAQRVLRAARVDALSRRHWTIQGAAGEVARAPLGAARGDRVEVDAALQLDAELRGFDLAPPSIEGLRVHVAALRCTTPGGALDLDLDDLVGVDLEREADGRWVVSGPRPRLTVEFDPEPVHVLRVQVTGEVE